jgi:hypothetical protein
MIMGGTKDKRFGFKYGYALDFLCRHLGEIPDNESWCSIRYETLDAIDTVLKDSGVRSKTFSVAKFLVERGAPVDIPKPDDFPSIGYLTRDEIPAILALLTPEKLSKAIRRSDESDYFEGAFGELRSWLEACTKANRDLICFYY